MDQDNCYYTTNNSLRIKKKTLRLLVGDDRRESKVGKSELFWLALHLNIEVLASSITFLTNLLKVVIILQFEIHSFI